MANERRLHIPKDVPEDFANAVATLLLLGIAGAQAWDKIYIHPPETSLDWIERILASNDMTGLVHTDIEWWGYQLGGH